MFKVGTEFDKLCIFFNTHASYWEDTEVYKLFYHFFSIEAYLSTLGVKECI
jgi:hypothetical protein